MGSRDELEQFLTQRHQNLVRFAYVITADPSDAQDLVQNALVEVFRRWRTIDPSGAEAYTRKVIARQAWRAAKRPRTVHLDALAHDLPATIEDVPAALDVHAALGALSPDRRIVLVLRYWLGYTEKEVARELGCSIGTVKSRAHRALAQLRDQLAVSESLSIEVPNSHRPQEGSRP